MTNFVNSANNLMFTLLGLMAIICICSAKPRYAEVRFTDAPTYQEFRLGENALIRCSASGVPAPSITWKHNGHRLLSDLHYKQTRGGLLIRDMSYMDEGIYLCVAEVLELGIVETKVINVLLSDER